uniref:Keratinocytes associated protein 2 n=1 Tax=Argas monolakensis TaxID=34602 RepID=Q09JK4_ARGMO|nr:keratinocytes associated protein 2 [Argas monolakensis]
MAVSSAASGALSLCLFFLLFATMQIYRVQLTASQPMTVVGGFLGSLLFILLLTLVGNVQRVLCGQGVQTKLFPEVVICLVLAMTSAGMVHRVCTTTCLIFSIVALYYLSKISVKPTALTSDAGRPIPQNPKGR